MKVLVTGSRLWTDLEPIRAVLNSIALTRKVGDGEITLLHGDAFGADRIAASEAFFRGWVIKAFPADWARHGKRAGILRNLQMLDENPDRVIAFQRNGSRGTQHVIDEARRRGIPVEVYEGDGGGER